MGNFISKNERKRPRPGAEPGVARPLPSRPAQMEPEEEALQHLRRVLHNDIDSFVLNNALMAVQFFDNFERDMASIRNTPYTEAEMQSNAQMSSHHRHCVWPDKLHELVAKRVVCRRQHGPTKKRSEVLCPRRIHVVHDNVEAVEGNESAYGYSSISDPNTYHMAVETAERPGYVKLRSIGAPDNKRRNTYEAIKRQPEDNVSNSEELESPSNEYTDSASKQNSSIYLKPPLSEADRLQISKQGFHNHENRSPSGKEQEYTKKTSRGPRRSNNNKAVPLPLPTSSSLPNLEMAEKTKSRYSPPPNSDSSGYKSYSNPNSRGSDSTDYGYATITELRTPKPVKMRRLGNVPTEASGIPSQCFERKEICNYEDSESDSDEMYEKTIASRKLFHVWHYLNSTSYMASFADVFVEILSTILGFTAESTECATMQGEKIYCDLLQHEVDKSQTRVRMNITPSIHCRSWSTQAFEWPIRDRRLFHDPRSNIAYIWPTKLMIDNVKKFGYHIVPLGYAPTRGLNGDTNIEWQVSFPEAERYLETCLRHSQVRCYLFALAIYKSFLEPLVDSELNLLPSHIRTVLFWQCEQNFASWPDDRPGESLKKLLWAVYDTLKKERLADYFIPAHNKYESIPSRNLRQVQQKLSEILENIVMYSLIAVRDLRYVSRDGEDSPYPILDCRKLFTILTTDDFVTLLNPALGMHTIIQPNQGAQANDSSGEEETVWDENKGHDRTRNWQRKLQRQRRAENVAKKLAAGRRVSIESIDVQVKPKTRSGDDLRRKLILELLIPHFIEMAKRNLRYRAMNQARFYSEHSERLLILLREENTSDVEVIEKFSSQVAILKDKIANLKTNNTPISPNYLKTHILAPPVPKTPAFDPNKNNLTLVEVYKQPSLQKTVPLEDVENESSDL